MVKSHALWCLMLGGVMLVGCKKEEAAAPTVPTPGTKPSALDSAKDALKGAGTEAGEAMTAGSNAVQAQAKGMVQKVKDMLEKNDLDSADGIMQKLDAMKDKLPQSVQDEIASLRTKFDAMKGAAGTAIKSATTKPALPVTPPAIP